MKLYKLDKTVLSLRNNPAQFLSGLTSNTLEKPQNAFLTVHGRIVATFEQLRIDDDEYWLIAGSPFIDPLLKHLDKYIRLSAVEMKRLEQRVYFQTDPHSSQEIPPGRALLLKQGRLIISDNDLEVNISEDEFNLFRLLNRFPLQGIDYTDEFILNIGDDDFVSFTKGCFLGQEPVSKVHNRSRPTWQLVVKYEDQCDEEMKLKMTSKVLAPDTKRVLGFTFMRNTA